MNTFNYYRFAKIILKSAHATDRELIRRYGEALVNNQRPDAEVINGLESALARVRYAPYLDACTRAVTSRNDPMWMIALQDTVARLVYQLSADIEAVRS